MTLKINRESESVTTLTTVFKSVKGCVPRASLCKNKTLSRSKMKNWEVKFNLSEQQRAHTRLDKVIHIYIFECKYIYIYIILYIKIYIYISIAHDNNIWWSFPVAPPVPALVMVRHPLPTSIGTKRVRSSNEPMKAMTKSVCVWALSWITTGGFHKMGLALYRWRIYFIENPIYFHGWFGGTHILGNLQLM